MRVLSARIRKRCTAAAICHRMHVVAKTALDQSTALFIVIVITVANAIVQWLFAHFLQHLRQRHIVERTDAELGKDETATSVGVCVWGNEV